MTDLLHGTTFPSAQVRVDGALDLQENERGLRPRRLPAWTRAQLPHPFVDVVVQATAGVRLVLRTQATVLELTLHTTRVVVPGSGPLPAAVDLVVDGSLVRRESLTGGDLLHIVSVRNDTEIVPGEAETVRFSGLDAGDKQVEIWLPQSVACDLISLRADAELRTPAPDTRPRWVHHGSSISHCLEAEGPTGTWPSVAATALGLQLTNFGFAGNAMLDPFVARTIRDMPADLISLKIGANITEQATMRLRTFLPAVHGFLNTIREGHPDTPVMVISPIPSPTLEDTPGPTVTDPETGRPRASGSTDQIPLGALTLTTVRENLRDLVAERRRTDPALSHLDGRELLRADETADLHDGLHPTAAAYLRMGARFADIVSARSWGDA
ncbi:SGNH/GDSL hydrolase family protein [Streptomyces sp. NPDC057137]|uniref:SGNH/GDSL hydrolase family protein n=1 Tax=Streptomyces sp. NPDC057137 TaxID=3346030 RepID=UPI003634327E